jgi:hypothetical protein
MVTLFGSSIGRLLFLGSFLLFSSHVAIAAEVVTLTQTPCQFIEPEGGDRHFVSTRKADCVAENKTSGADRVANADVITLKPGDYIFRVTNETVSYSLGFWLREADYDWKNPLHKLTKISVSGGGLATGVTKDYEVTLEPGEYLYSCPLNTTPDYKLVVEN